MAFELSRLAAPYYILGIPTQTVLYGVKPALNVQSFDNNRFRQNNHYYQNYYNGNDLFL